MQLEETNCARSKEAPVNGPSCTEKIESHNIPYGTVVYVNLQDKLNQATNFVVITLPSKNTNPQMSFS